MDLNKATLYKAMLARDKRFDGRFYIGVRTTGIYCRPVCPARPKQKNVDFYRSAAEAEAKGFRPCLRCRPDLSPSSPSFSGTAAVVGRALRLIGEGQGDSLEKLAERLGLTSRHLRRLFEEHVGASPVEVSSSKRLHHARLLLSQTRLPITEVAFASGFRSLRRFNDSFKARYKKPPSAFRKEGAAGAAGLTLELPVLEPFEWDYLYRFLRANRIEGIERFENGAYERLIPGKVPGLLRVARAKGHLLVTLENIEPSAIRGVLSRVRQLFDLDHNPASPCGPHSLGGVRIPGAFDGFETAVGIILGQMVSVDVARAKVQRLVDLYGATLRSPWPGLGKAFPSPETLATADLQPLGITRVRAGAIRELARLVATGELDLSRSAPLEETRVRLAAIPGIGPWTVEMIAMRCLADPDAFPSGDLIVKRALEQLKLKHEAWAPWRAYLSLWVWKNYAQELSRKPPRRGDPRPAKPRAKKKGKQ